MAKNNNVVIDGVSYELSPADNMLLRQILARSHVQGDIREPAPMPKPMRVVATGPKLTDADVTRLVGHNNTVYYNFETDAWNTNRYNGYTINDQKTDTKRALAFRSVMEKELSFRAQYEMAALITMTIDGEFYPGWTGTICNPKYSERGTAVVGNIIVRNKTNVNYELYCRSWIGVGDCGIRNVAVACVAYWFACFGGGDSIFRSALIAAHTR